MLALEAQKTPKFKALERMKGCDGKYDPKVLEAVAAGFDIHLSADEEDNTESAAITFEELRVGAVLKSDLYTTDGILVLPAGSEINQMLMEKLRNFSRLSGIKEPIYVQSN